MALVIFDTDVELEVADLRDMGLVVMLLGNVSVPDTGPVLGSGAARFPGIDDLDSLGEVRLDSPGEVRFDSLGEVHFDSLGEVRLDSRGDRLDSHGEVHFDNNHHLLVETDLLGTLDHGFRML